MTQDVVSKGFLVDDAMALWCLLCECGLAVVHGECTRV